MAANAGSIRAGQAYVEITTDDSLLKSGLAYAKAKIAAWGASVKGLIVGAWGKLADFTSGARASIMQTIHERFDAARAGTVKEATTAWASLLQTVADVTDVVLTALVPVFDVISQAIAYLSQVLKDNKQALLEWAIILTDLPTVWAGLKLAFALAIDAIEGLFRKLFEFIADSVGALLPFAGGISEKLKAALEVNAEASKANLLTLKKEYEDARDLAIKNFKAKEAVAIIETKAVEKRTSVAGTFFAGAVSGLGGGSQMARLITINSQANNHLQRIMVLIQKNNARKLGVPVQ